MARKKMLRVDWDSVEPLYRAGALSNYQICDQYAADHQHSQKWKPTVTEAAIRGRAKKKGWKKDLAKKVKAQVKENLVRESVRDANQIGNLNDKEIIEKAAEAGANVVLKHRKQIDKLLTHEDALLKELECGPSKVHISVVKGKVVKTVLVLTVSEKAKTLKDLASVRAQRIALEREAYNIGDGDGGGEDKNSFGNVIKRELKDRISDLK